MFPQGNRNRFHISTVSTASQYFVITITNFPNLLERTQQFSGQHCPYQINASLAVHDQHERQLYEELANNLQHVIQGYLQRTRQPYPIRIVFDFSHIQLP